MRIAAYILATACVTANASDSYVGIYKKDLPGCYWNKIQGESVENPKEIVTAYSYLHIKPNPRSGKLSFIASTVGGLLGNARYCSAEGNLDISDFGDLMILKFEPTEEQERDPYFQEQRCRLQIIVTPKEMIFYEPDRACQEYFMCGVGAGFHGIRFGRQHKKPPKGADVCPP